MELTWKIIILCLIGAALAGLLKKSSPELALLLAIAAVIWAFWAVLERVGDIFAFMQTILQSTALQTELFSPLLKIIGIAWVTAIGADICRDSGQSGMGTAIEMAGTFGAIAAAGPLFEEIWKLLNMLL